MSSRLTHWNLKWVCYVHILITINTYFLCTHLSVLFLCNSALTTKGGMWKNLRKCSWNAFCFSVNGFKQTSGRACLSMVSAWWEKRQYCQGFKCALSGLWKDVSSVECSQLLECFLWAQWFLECVPLRWKRTRKDVFIWVHVFGAFVFLILLIRLHLFHFLFKFCFLLEMLVLILIYTYIFQPYVSLQNSF